ncbi:hypothetical protein AB1Y20_001849 [Prymnesium parvum]|uniref:Acetoacetate decarboxylase n=1 Tax=Prymnesium parvum TaxID=97485 RepID=A0AB34K8Z7_PRYPA
MHLFTLLLLPPAHSLHLSPPYHPPSLLRPAPTIRRHARRTPPLRLAEANGVDPAFPYRFEGRLWFRPALVRAPTELPEGLAALSLFGWTVGGVVALEYDISPVGPYLEYVTMGSLVTKRGALGQWGSDLYVSTAAAEEVCRRVWGVPAQHAHIAFANTSAPLRVELPPRAAACRAEVSVAGWAAVRTAAPSAARRGGLRVLWTPRLKALWAPLVPLPAAPRQLQLHALRLSAGSVRLVSCGQPPSDALGVPLGVGLTVDALRIEIGPQLDEGL